MAWEQKVINKLEALGFSSQEIGRLQSEGFDRADIDRIEADPRMVNSRQIRLQISKDLMFLILAAEDNEWDVVDRFVGELLYHIVRAMVVRWSGWAPGILNVIDADGDSALRDASARRARALKAIEAGLRHEKKTWKANHTDTKRVNMVLGMFKQMYVGGLSRKEALRNIEKNESSVKQYARPVLRRLTSGEWGEPPPQDYVDAIIAKPKGKKRSQQHARSTDVRRKKR